MDDFLNLWGIAGEDITAHVQTITYDNGMDEVVESEDVEIENVLFGIPSAEDLSNADRLHGMRAEYKLCIPKTCDTGFAGAKITRKRDGSKWVVISDGPQLPPELTPTCWNREVLVARENG